LLLLVLTTKKLQYRYLAGKQQYQFYSLWFTRSELKQDSSAPIEKDSSAPRHFSTVEKKCQIGTAFSFKHTWLPFLK
jgi:hypothetical protein